MFDILTCGASFSTSYKSVHVLRGVPEVVTAAINRAGLAHGWAKAGRPGHTRTQGRRHLS
jgi:hypothetical protein